MTDQPIKPSHQSDEPNNRFIFIQNKMALMKTSAEEAAIVAVEGAISAQMSIYGKSDFRPIDSVAKRVTGRARPKAVRRVWTEEDCEKIRWEGAISRCLKCGDRGYLRGWCFGCGRPLLSIPNE